MTYGRWELPVIVWEMALKNPPLCVCLLESHLVFFFAPYTLFNQEVA